MVQQAGEVHSWGSALSIPGEMESLAMLAVLLPVSVMALGLLIGEIAYA